MKCVFRGSFFLTAAAAVIFSFAVASAATVQTGPRTQVGFRYHIAGASSGGVNSPPFAPYPEIPPWQVPQGWNTFYMTTDATYRCSSPSSLLGGSPFELQYCGLISKYYYNSPTSVWNTMYDGLFSAHTLTPEMQGKTSGDSIIIAFDHVENKNTIAHGITFQNTFEPWIKASGPNHCVSGTDSSGNYTDCWTAYNGIIEMSWQPSTAATGWGAASYYTHEGVVVWPSDGYIRPWTDSDPLPKYAQGVATNGNRHPHSIIDGNYIYLYYLDESPTNSGIKLARAPLTGGARPGTFSSFGLKDFSPSPDALPAGFTMENLQKFLSTPGPKNSTILGANRQSISFSAAHVGTGRCFAGVEEYLDPNGKWMIFLWKSNDLSHWTQVSTLRTSTNWGTGDLHYPIFLDSTGRTNTEIAADQFYIEGTDSGTGTVGLMKVHTTDFCNFGIIAAPIQASEK